MVYVYLADGFEEIEALTVVDLLRRAEIEVKTVSINAKLGVTGTHGIKVEADILYDDANHEECEMMVLPGGLPGADYLNEHEGILKHVKCFAKDPEKKVAAICAAPQVFGSCGILEGKRATIYPGMESYLKEGNSTGENVTVDGNIITGMGPAIATEFALKLIEVIKGKEAAEEVSDDILYGRI